MNQLDSNRIRVLLSFQRALLGRISDNLVSVTVGWKDDKIKAIMYFRDKISSEQIETASNIEGEVMADFTDTQVNVVPAECPQKVDWSEMMLDAWVFVRKLPED